MRPPLGLLDRFPDTGSADRRAPAPARPGPRRPPLDDHHSTYVEDVKELTRRGEHECAAALLLALIAAAEAESRARSVGVPPWYYEQLALVRRRQGDHAGEIAALERFAAMPHGPGAASERLMALLDDARHGRASPA